jgi:hypothetical protein
VLSPSKHEHPGSLLERAPCDASGRHPPTGRHHVHRHGGL